MAILLAAEIARRISGTEFPAFLEQAVFRPLKADAPQSQPGTLSHGLWDEFQTRSASVGAREPLGNLKRVCGRPGLGIAWMPPNASVVRAHGRTTQSLGFNPPCTRPTSGWSETNPRGSGTGGGISSRPRPRHAPHPGGRVASEQEAAISRPVCWTAALRRTFRARRSRGKLRDPRFDRGFLSKDVGNSRRDCLSWLSHPSGSG